MALLTGYGSVAAILVLLRRVGAGRQVQGSIASLTYYPELRVLEGEVSVPEGWPGHRAGQFAFATSDTAEGAHPYTIASAWNDAERRITFITKELGNVQNPGVRAIIDRLAASGSTLTPAQLVDQCLDLVGPLAVEDDTRAALVEFAARDGELHLQNHQPGDAAEQRIGDMLRIIAATREFQLA